MANQMGSLAEYVRSTSIFSDPSINTNTLHNYGPVYSNPSERSTICIQDQTEDKVAQIYTYQSHLTSRMHRLQSFQSLIILEISTNNDIKPSRCRYSSEIIHNAIKSSGALIQQIYLYVQQILGIDIYLFYRESENIVTESHATGGRDEYVDIVNDFDHITNVYNKDTIITKSNTINTNDDVVSTNDDSNTNNITQHKQQQQQHTARKHLRKQIQIVISNLQTYTNEVDTNISYLSSLLLQIRQENSINTVYCTHIPKFHPLTLLRSSLAILQCSTEDRDLYTIYGYLYEYTSGIWERTQIEPLYISLRHEFLPLHALQCAFSFIDEIDYSEKSSISKTLINTSTSLTHGYFLNIQYHTYTKSINFPIVYPISINDLRTTISTIPISSNILEEALYWHDPQNIDKKYILLPETIELSQQYTNCNTITLLQIFYIHILCWYEQYMSCTTGPAPWHQLRDNIPYILASKIPSSSSLSAPFFWHLQADDEQLLTLFDKFITKNQDLIKQFSPIKYESNYSEFTINSIDTLIRKKQSLLNDLNEIEKELSLRCQSNKDSNEKSDILSTPPFVHPIQQSRGSV